jgi:hypothetical protein
MLVLDFRISRFFLIFWYFSGISETRILENSRVLRKWQEILRVLEIFQELKKKYQEE